MPGQTRRRIVVTGVSRGLGRAMTRKFVELGHTVLGCARSSRAIRELTAAHPGPHRFEVVDVASDREVEAWATALLNEAGPPDLLVNNAALINRNAPAWEIDAEEFDRVIDVNIKGVMNVMRHFIPAMIGAGRGVIVNFSSGWGRSAAAEVAPYCATKWAVEGLTQSLAQELPPGLAAVPLNPGVINTGMLQSCFGPSASSCPRPEEWVDRAVSVILGLGPGHNGRPMSV